MAAPDPMRPPTARDAFSLRSAGLRLRESTLAWCATGLVLVYYVATMARDLSFYDSPELALAARVGGLGHPTGQPLHTMLGWLCARIPFVPPLVGLALLSALPAALCALPAAAFAEYLAPDVRTRVSRIARALVPAAFALHAAFHEPATRVEVYALAAMFALWAAAQVVGSIALASRTGWRWIAAGVSFGLSASANPYTALFTALAVAPALIAWCIDASAIAPIALVVVGGLAGLLPYAYVLAQAWREPGATFVWGFPGGPHALLRYATGADYARDRGASASMIADHAMALCSWAWTHGLVALVLVGVAAHVAARHAASPRAVRSALRLVCVISLALTVWMLAANVIFFVDVPDYLGYLEPPLWLCAAGAGAAIARALERRGRYAVYASIALAALVASIALAAPSPFVRTRSNDRLARAMASGALTEAPRDAVLVAASDQFVFPMMYLQQAEGLRPDIVLVAYGLTGSTWFWEQLYARHASLARSALIGPGDRRGRLQRFLAANPTRPVRFETWDLAVDARASPCADGWFLASGAACRANAPAHDEPTRALASWLARLGEGSPGSDEVIARVAQDRGEALWRMGDDTAALEALLAGVPAPVRSACATLPDATVLDRAPRFVGPLPVWNDGAPLGDPARDVALAALLLHRAGEEPAALRCLRARDALVR
jgi:hypothetical protein